jgi:hypothetical protein
MDTVAMMQGAVKERRVDGSPRQLARIAGALYLINIVCGFFAIGYVPAVIVVSGDPTATAHNILAHESLYRLGIVAHVIGLLTNIPLLVIFYELFKVVNRRISLSVASFLVVGAAIEGAYLLNQFTPLLLLQGGTQLNDVTAAQLQAQVSLPLQQLAAGYSLAQVFYVGYLLLTGYLIVRSSFLPRILGVLLAFGGLCYLVYSFAYFLFPEFAARLVPYIQLPSGIGELSLCLWLLVVGVNVQKWTESAELIGATHTLDTGRFHRGPGDAPAVEERRRER